MLTSKQRAKLRAIVSTMPATTIVGKDGLTDTVLDQIDKQLYAHEIVKVSVLESAELSARDYLQEASQKLKAEQVNFIGSKFALYRVSNKKGIKHIAID